MTSLPLPNDHDDKKASTEKVPLEFTVTAEQAARADNPPYDNSVVEDLHGKRVSDPFRPMENMESPEVLEWVERQNKTFDAALKPHLDVKDDTIKFLNDALPEGMRETMPTRIGKEDYKYLVWKKKKDDPRWSLFIKDVPDYEADATLLLDPLQIDPSGKTDIVGQYPTKDGKVLAYALSVSGSDEMTMLFLDLETGEHLDLSYDKFRSGIIWDRDGKGFHYHRPMQGALSKSFEICYHKMGTEPKDDFVVFSPDEPETQASYTYFYKDSTDDLSAYEAISISNTEANKNALLIRERGSNEEFQEIFPHEEGELSPVEEIDGKILAITTLDAPNGKLVLVDPENSKPENWKTILPENTEDPLVDVFVWQNKIFASYTHDTGDVLKVYDLEGAYLHDVPIPPLSTYDLGHIHADESTCLLSITNFQEGGTIYEYDSAKNELEEYRASQLPIDLKDCIVERIHATSEDGTQVPMTVIRDPNTKLDGTAATLLYGYGGFDVPLEPYFSASIAHWVRSGGIYVQANLRGGGEFGQDWYDAGRLENKQNVFDDFAACARHLASHKYTSPKRLAIQGGSNGGLLTLATLLQNPKDTFGAVVSEVPVADMFRFMIGSFWGDFWKSDYGDPQNVKEDFDVAAEYSPLHNVVKDMEHTPLLISTDMNDDRVEPWHSFKMAAMLQAFEDPDSKTWLSTRTDGGHGAGMTEQQRFEDIGTIRAFLRATLGPIHQDEYKKSDKYKKDRESSPPTP